MHAHTHMQRHEAKFEKRVGLEELHYQTLKLVMSHQSL